MEAAPPSLDRALGAAADPDAACAAAVTALAAGGRLRACAYLARAGRLRCQASAGAAHVLDGVPISSGPVGRALHTGAEQHDRRPDGTLDAICVPLRAGPEVIGVLELSADAGLEAEEIAGSRATAAALAARIAALGGPPPEGPASRLAQHAAALAGLQETPRIERALLIAALDLAEMESALLIRRGEDGSLHASCAAGPGAGALLALGPRALGELADVAAGGASSSCTAAPDAAPELLPAPLRALRDLAASTAVVTPLSARGAAIGVLVLADRRTLALTTDTVELVELIAVQGASCLRTAAAVADLRRRAATDPLTGLGHRGSFDAALEASHRRPVATAIVLCDLDRFKELNDRLGHQEGDRALVSAVRALQSALRRGDRLFRLGGDEFAALLAVRDETEALAAARRMRAAVAGSDAGLTVSVGVAVSVPEESDHALLGRADRALYRAKAEGRDEVVLAAAASAPVG